MELDDVAARLFSDAVEVDADGPGTRDVLAVHWALLAEAGLLGVQARGGTAEAGRVLASLAGGCLTTAFLWLQHEGATAAVTSSPLTGAPGGGPVDRLHDGTVRAGLALAGLRPGPEQLHATPAGDGVGNGWSLSGRVPWVTGFGLVDQLQVAAVHGEDVVFLLVPASAPGLTGTVQPLVAAAASATATVRFDRVAVAADRELRRVPLQEWSERQQHGVALNGFLALGVARRCARLAQTTYLDAELDDLGTRLAASAPEQLPGLRADAALLAVRAATHLVVTTGAGAAVRGTHAERLWREASLLLVFASRPRIKDATLDRLLDARDPTTS